MADLVRDFTIEDVYLNNLTLTEQGRKKILTKKIDYSKLMEGFSDENKRTLETLRKITIGKEGKIEIKPFLNRLKIMQTAIE